jgi:hypothetical protein
LESAAASGEATPGKGVRRQSTSLVSIESPMGMKREATHAGGGSQPEKRHALAVEVLKIDRKNPVRRDGRVFE